MRTHVFSQACKKFGVKRVAIVTSIGAGDSENQAPFMFKILMNTVRKTHKEHAQVISGMLSWQGLYTQVLSDNACCFLQTR